MRHRDKFLFNTSLDESLRNIENFMNQWKASSIAGDTLGWKNFVKFDGKRIYQKMECQFI